MAAVSARLLGPESLSCNSRVLSSNTLSKPSLPNNAAFSRSKTRSQVVICRQTQFKENKSLKEPLKAAARVREAVAIFAVAAALAMAAPGAALADTLVAGGAAEVFATTCAGCHYKGGNVVQAGATLFTKDLERNNMNTEEAIYKITYFGKGKMPGYGAECKPRGQCTFGPRLSDSNIHALSDFVLAQAGKGWQ
ncbi:cytochrome c6 [Klebsormidium nitens]|uniref:Cytochrome c-553 n=1 Tax=Klebsormidium nitens TaxID=105231 RepID=A0A1Y1HKU7_KLENI|nr:cytochrome c6 [Klebsormidium nitens]|eukprot:GAQ79230.1 cytochrome c6 [Klebsormidium nitens]